MKIEKLIEYLKTASKLNIIKDDYWYDGDELSNLIIEEEDFVAVEQTLNVLGYKQY